VPGRDVGHVQHGGYKQRHGLGGQHDGRDEYRRRPAARFFRYIRHLRRL
jgi:hypothetical protein